MTTVPTQDVQVHRIQSRSAEEISTFIEKIYAPNAFAFTAKRRAAVTLEGRSWAGVGVYNMDCPTPFIAHWPGARAYYLWVYCTQGSLSFSSAGGVHACLPGDVMLLGPAHSLSCTASRTGAKAKWLILSTERVQSLLARGASHRAKSALRSLSCELLTPERARQWAGAQGCLQHLMDMRPLPHHIVEALLRLQVTSDPPCRPLASPKLSMKQYLARSGEPADTALAPSPYSPEQIDRIVDASLAQRLTTAELAEMFELSASDLKSLFLARCGCSPLRYVNERRMRRVKWLLQNTNKTALNIAIECGFPSQSYLSIKVRQRWAMTPTQLREAKSVPPPLSFNELRIG